MQICDYSIEHHGSQVIVERKQSTDCRIFQYVHFNTVYFTLFFVKKFKSSTSSLLVKLLSVAVDGAWNTGSVNSTLLVLPLSRNIKFTPSQVKFNYLGIACFNYLDTVLTVRSACHTTSKPGYPPPCLHLDKLSKISTLLVRHYNYLLFLGSLSAEKARHYEPRMIAFQCPPPPVSGRPRWLEPRSLISIDIGTAKLGIWVSRSAPVGILYKSALSSFSELQMLYKSIKQTLCHCEIRGWQTAPLLLHDQDIVSLYGIEQPLQRHGLVYYVRGY